MKHDPALVVGVLTAGHDAVALSKYLETLTRDELHFVAIGLSGLLNAAIDQDGPGVSEAIIANCQAMPWS